MKHDIDQQALRSQFELDGFVAIPNFLSAEELREANAHKRRILDEVVPQLPATEVYYEDKQNKRSLKQIQHLEAHEPYFAALLSESPIERLACALLGESVIGRNLQYFNKAAGIGLATPPHQDGFYFMLEPCNALTMWLALEDVGREQGCLHYVRGSHALGMRAHRRSKVLGFSQHITDYGTASDLANTQVQLCEAGTLIVHDALTIHFTEDNTSATRQREALGFNYFGVSAREDVEAQAEYQQRLAGELAARGKI